MPSHNLLIKLRQRHLVGFYKTIAHISTISTVSLHKSKWHRKTNTIHFQKKAVPESMYIAYSESSIPTLYNVDISHQENYKNGNKCK